MSMAENYMLHLGTEKCVSNAVLQLSRDCKIL